MRTIRRAKALCELLLPVVAAAAAILIAGEVSHHTPPTASQPRQESDTLSATSADASIDVTHSVQDIPGKGATTVTTYTVTGTF